MAGAANAGEIRARMVLENMEFMRKMQEARNEMDVTKKSAQNFGAGLGAIGMGAAAVGAAVVGAVGVAVQTAAKFEQSMAKVKAVSGATEEQFAMLEETALSLGETTVFSASEAADGMGILAMAGFDTNQIIAAMPANMNLAAAAGVNLAKSSDVLTSVMSGFGIKAEDTGAAVDSLVKAMNIANLDLPDLGESMKYIAPVAASMKMGLEDVTAAIALMSNYGIKGSQAGTTLRAGLLALAKPAENASKSMDALGLEVMDAQGNMKAMPELIDALNASMEGMTETQKVATLASWTGTEAASGFLALMNEGGDTLRDYSKQLEDAEGTAQKMADTMNDTMLGSWREFTGALETAGIKLGKEFIPMVRDLLKHGTELTRMFSGMPPEIVATTIKIAGATAGVALLGVGIVKAIDAFKLLRLAFVNNPIGLAILGISTLAGAYVGYKDSVERANTVSLEHYNKLAAKQSTIQDTIGSYDALAAKLLLNNDEMLLYIDLQKRLQDTTDPSKIEAMTSQMDKLQEKSGLSKDEMQKLVKASDDLIKIAPDTDAAIDGNGNSFATTAEKAKKVNDALIEQMNLELELQAMKMEKNAGKHMEDYKNAVKEGNVALRERYDGFVKEEGIRYQMGQLEKRIREAKKKGDKDAVFIAERELETQKRNLREQQNINIKNQETVIAKQKQLDKANSVLRKDKEVYDQLIRNQTAQLGINAKKGQEVKAIETAIKKLETQRQKIIDNAGGYDKLTGKKKEEIRKIDESIDKHKKAKDAVDGIKKKQDELNSKIEKNKNSAGKLHKELTKDASKKVKFTGDGFGLAQIIHDKLAAPVKKTVSIWQQVFGGGKGKDKKHSGGLLYDIEPTREKFHSGGSPAMRSPQQIAHGTKLDEVDVRILRDEMVLTKGQQFNLFNMIRTFNAVASRKFASKEGAQSIVNGGTKISIGQLVVREEADVKRIAEELDRLERTRKRFKGEY